MRNKRITNLSLDSILCAIPARILVKLKRRQSNSDSADIMKIKNELRLKLLVTARLLNRGE